MTDDARDVRRGSEDDPTQGAGETSQEEVPTQVHGDASDARASAGDDAAASAEDSPSVASVVGADSNVDVASTIGADSTAGSDSNSGAASAASAEQHPTGERAWHAKPLPRALIIALTLAGVAYALMFFRGLQDIIAPVFLALNFYIVVYPLQKFLTRVKVPRAIGASISVVLVLCMILAFFGLTAWSVAELVILIPSYSNELVTTYQNMLAFLSDIGVTSSVIEQQLSQFNVRSIIDAVYPLLTNVSMVAGLLTTVVMAVFFVAMDSLGIDRRMRMLLDIKPAFSTSLGDFASGVRRYWVVATIFGLIVAFLDVIALAIIDVPLVWVWGVLAFLTNYIPNIGFVIGLIPPALLALVDSGWQSGLWVIIAYSVLNFVIQAIIQPKFTGESVGVTPLISFLSLLFWVWVLGWLGALLALPATLLLKALLVDADPRAKWVNILLASDPETARVESEKSLVES
ncbi:AI-2E family transporter [Brevibacterium sp. GP-SGM9]|uniref:AI-2E family transporter n=1 Tax=Brevibacterium sp. GP-SGM9 TaxID=3376990 RepID=UPI0039A5AD6F